MPLHYLTARERSTSANWKLAALLAFVAGAVDVSGYLALRQFTSHMSGIVSALAADFALRGAEAIGPPSLVLVSFIAGAAVCALLVNFSRRRHREGLYALPLLLEATLLACIAFPAVPSHILLTLSLLSFSMGLQNAIIAKISHAEIRTTHITGMITDIGIELGKALYWSRHTDPIPVHADRHRLAHLSMLVALFVTGGALGAFLYPRIGFYLMLPLALLLALPSILPIASDLHIRHRPAPAS